jgi:KTSC domain
MRRCSPSALLAILFLVATIGSGAPLRTADDTSIVSRIRRVPVESRALAAVGYSKRLHALEIEFRNGAIYRYLDVPRSLHKALMNAPSRARFYHKNIRGKYRVVHVRPRAR